MLYITTRSNKDVYTAYKTLLSDVAPDNGLYIPFQMPAFDENELSSLRYASFSEIIAKVLNLFFSADISSWSVECVVGRNCLKLKSLGQKNLVAELWHNPERKYTAIENSLFALLGGDNKVCNKPTNWGKIAIRVSVLFGIYGHLLSEEYLHINDTFHISVRTDDCICLSAAYYAKMMGLPISMFLCADADEIGIWDYFHHGELSTSLLHTKLSYGLERLTHAAFGAGECQRMLFATENKTTFSVAEDAAPLSCSIFCSVIGSDRTGNVINSVYRNCGYLIDADTALTYATVQDFRSKTGENRLTILLGEKDPVLSADIISGATGLTVEEIASVQKK